jgi:rod shape-determining protein MreD
MRKLNVLKWAVYTLIFILLSVFQLQVAFYPKFMDVTPLFLIPAVIVTAMFEGDTAGGIFGIVAGLIWDSGTGRVFGFNALFLMVIGICIGLFVKFLFKNTLLNAFLFTIVFTFTHELATWFFFYYMTSNHDIIYALLHVILPTEFLTIIFVLPLFYGIRALNRRMTPKDSDITV